MQVSIKNYSGNSPFHTIPYIVVYIHLHGAEHSLDSPAYNRCSSMLFLLYFGALHCVKDDLRMPHLRYVHFVDLCLVTCNTYDLSTSNYAKHMSAISRDVMSANKQKQRQHQHQQQGNKRGAPQHHQGVVILQLPTHEK